MAIAFDAKSTGVQSGTPANFNHTPVATPQLVVVSVVQDGAADDVPLITYGGVSVPQRIEHHNASGSSAYLFDLLTGIPGVGGVAQAVAETQSGSNSKVVRCVTFTAAAAVEADTAVSSGLTSANPSQAITPTAAGVIVAALTHDLATAVTARGAGQVDLHTADQGTWNSTWDYKIVASGGATTMSYTIASDFWALVACAYHEAGPAALPIPDLLMAPRLAR